MKLELQHTGFNRFGHILKTLYIDGKETEHIFAQTDEIDTCGNVGDGDYPRFYNKIKNVSALDLPIDISISFWSITGKLTRCLHYGEMKIVELIRRKTFFEVGISIRFSFRDTVASNLNPLKLLRLCNAYAKEAGFKRTEIMLTERKEWYDMFSGTFYYRSKNDSQTLEEKLHEGIAAFNKLLDKAAAEMQAS